MVDIAARWAADGRLYAVLAAAGFSLKAVFVKLAYAAHPVEPLTLLALRMAFALPLFLWLIWKSRTPGTQPLSRGDVTRVWVLALLGYYLSSLFDFHGLTYITAGLERLILYLYPTMVLLFDACRTRRAPSARAWQAMLICYVGLGIAVSHDLQQAGAGTDVLTGAAWVFASALTYALYYLGTGDLVKRIGSMRLAGLAGSASCVLVLGHFLLFGHPLSLPQLPMPVFTWSLLMAVLSTALPIYWLSLAIQRLGAAQAAAVGTLGPVLTVFAAWALLGETLSALQLAGLALVMLGVTRLKPKQDAAAATAVRTELKASQS
ncbi:DMT family transporter [Noviherbaspirillum saxi]|uniref:DMT family transporter n=2 Tax=Noviherbaspirillum saxi TaxID=2320863 RepID=A0A3A3G0D5_9BURK|nr:DMT family transporter [Noviherbaspirillum saxi]